MKQNKIIVGMTGGSGVGKTVIGEQFALRGCKVIDCDIIARSVVEVGKPALLEIKSELSHEVIQKDGSLNRKKLAEIVFSDKEKLDLLNKITHKYIKEEIFRIIKESKEQVVIIDAPALYESGLDAECDFIVCVLAERELRIKRIMERDNLTQHEADMRINAQKDDEYYMSKADFVIRSKDDNMSEEVDRCLNKIVGGR